MEGAKGLKLFGVRIVEEERSCRQEGTLKGKEDAVKMSMLKSLSMVDLAAWSGTMAEEQRAGDHGYLSDGGIEQSSRGGGKEKKRGVPWTEEEHRTFLTGLEMLGKGDWRGISRNFVITRTPTQVASHAQKYFLRQNNPNKKKRRSSLFDVMISNKITNSETPPPTSPLKKSDETFLMFDDHVSQENHSAVCLSFSSIQPAPQGAATCSNTSNLDEEVYSTELAAQTLSPNQRHAVSDQAVTTFLKLSLPPCPTQTLANSSTIDSGDLELTIAPPQSHSSLAKFSSGVIRVV